MRREKANEMLLPNPAFDLARLACSLLDEFYQGTSPNSVAIPSVADSTSDVARAYAEHLYDRQAPTVSAFYNMLCEWITDGDRAPINRFDNFDLYKQIARRMRRTVPKHQLQRPHFAQYVCEEEATANAVWYDLTARAPLYTTPLDNAIDRPAYHATIEYDGYNSDDDDFLGGWGGDGDSCGGGLDGFGELLRAGEGEDGADAIAKLMSKLMGGDNRPSTEEDTDDDASNDANNDTDDNRTSSPP